MSSSDGTSSEVTGDCSGCCGSSSDGTSSEETSDCSGCVESCNNTSPEKCLCGCCWDCIRPENTSVIMTLFGTLMSAFFCVFVLGLVQNFDSRGPLYLTLFGSCILAINLLGIRFKRNITEKTCSSLRSNFSDSRTTTLGWLTFVHSHHCLAEREAGHEFKIGEKFFCTGCFGILIGTVVSITVGITYYFIIGLNSSLTPLLILIIPFCFIPIMLRYLLFSEMKTTHRLLSNILLPIGCCLLFLVFESAFHSWFVNVSLILVCIMIAFLRTIAQKVDKRKAIN